MSWDWPGWRRARSFHGSRNGMARRDNWTLEIWQYEAPLTCYSEYLISTRVTAEVRYVLSGLAVTPREADDILARRGYRFAPPQVSMQYGCRPAHGTDPVLVMDDIELTMDEAAAIVDGTDPVAALAPRIRARLLSLQEMMGA